VFISIERTMMYSYPFRIDFRPKQVYYLCTWTPHEGAASAEPCCSGGSKVFTVPLQIALPAVIAPETPPLRNRYNSCVTNSLRFSRAFLFLFERAAEITSNLLLSGACEERSAKKRRKHPPTKPECAFESARSLKKAGARAKPESLLE
jgi:hypothetical protein